MSQTASTTASKAAQSALHARKPSVRSLFDNQTVHLVPIQCRYAPETMIGHQKQTARRFFRHPLSYLYNRQVLPRMSEHFLIKAINHYAMDLESPFSKHVYETEATSVQLNFVYLHLWLLKYHLGQSYKDAEFVKAEVRKSRHNKARTKISNWNVSCLTNRLIEKEHVSIFTSMFDDSIHEELKRQNRVINHSLSAVFEHSPKAINQEQRLVSRLDDDDLEELILYNILNEEPEARREQIKRISDYIRISVHEEDAYTFAGRMESYYYSTNEDGLLKKYVDEFKKERFRQK